MRLIRAALIAAVLASAGAALASPAVPRNGAEYQTLATPMPVAPAGKKVEVIEFFMYHCPACHALEPALAAWVKKQGDAINFRRIHMPHMQNDPEAHLFLALEALQLGVTLHDQVLHTWHVERQRLRTDDDNLAWAVKQGIDKQKFLDAYNSFGVTTRLRNLEKLMNSYHVDSTPTLVINGRYLTSPSMVMEKNPDVPRASLEAATFQVVDALVRKAQQDMAK